ncbi:DUF6089 family protein [Arcicella sp. LKC2W]|uniref:DUF6089 family protein n=1 Tax=Arcicella sp. LKC2W TaxID=2984198 RepID=UPI002B2192C7|nr:DUF6089 family protein [Arcicella sp. LKC2W]MEA5461907.1 DUF6089 family protein [Arcicella sp. LKC2W]
MKKNILIFFFFTQLSTFAQRQNLIPAYNRFDKNLSIDLGFGTAHYLGDIHPANNVYSYISTVRWNVTSGVTYQFSPLFSARLGISWIRISANDFTFAGKNMAANPQSDAYDLQFLRNLHFRNDLKEASLVGTLNLKNGFSNRRSNRPEVMPYVLAGVVIFSSSAQARDKFDASTNQIGAWTDVNISNIKPSIKLGIPLGFGIRKKISNNFDIVAEVAYRITVTDALDDIVNMPYQATLNTFENRSTEVFNAYSGESRAENFNIISNRQGFSTYNGTAQNLPPTIGYPNPIPQRGETGNDAYWTTSFKLRYYFNKRIFCPR